MKTKQSPLWFKQLLCSLLVCGPLLSLAQGGPTDSIPDDPGAISVYTIRNMSFGAFSVGSAGGTVGLSNAGTRSFTGDVVGLNMGVSWYHAIFDIDTPVGSIVSLLNGANTVLRGSNGGTILLRLGDSDPPSPFITVAAQPGRTQVNTGGTLVIGSSALSPPGIYTGSFYITFNHE